MGGSDRPDEFVLRSADRRVEAAISPKFGGNIVRIVDHANLPGLNLVAGEHGGAGLQSAFWLAERHEKVPPGCPESRGDMWYENPTQGGYYADVMSGRHLGNPIGVLGNGENAPPDPEEFIRTENEGRVIHFKSRFIRHDYCRDPVASIENRDLWDTDFYLEQWLSFDERRPRTLRMRSRIEHVGSKPTAMGSRQLPILFARHLPRLAYWKDGGKRILARPGAPVNPDRTWAAVIAEDREVGIGMVFAPGTTFHDFGNPPKGVIGYGLVDGVSRLFPGRNGAPDLDTFGRCVKVRRGKANTWVFEPGGTFTWNVYLPIGMLEEIRAAAIDLLNDPAAWQ